MLQHHVGMWFQVEGVNLMIYLTLITKLCSPCHRCRSNTRSRHCSNQCGMRKILLPSALGKAPVRCTEWIITKIIRYWLCNDTIQSQFHKLAYKGNWKFSSSTWPTRNKAYQVRRELVVMRMCRSTTQVLAVYDSISCKICAIVARFIDELPNVASASGSLDECMCSWKLPDLHVCKHNQV